MFIQPFPICRLTFGNDDYVHLSMFYFFLQEQGCCSSKLKKTALDAVKEKPKTNEDGSINRLVLSMQ